MLGKLYDILDHDLDKRVRATSPTVGVIAMVAITLTFATALTLVMFGIYP